MIIYVAGGSKSGKSSIAEECARKLGGPLYYIATMIPSDEEDETRIEKHVASRAGSGFTTIERGRDIIGLEADPEGTYLLDSITALLGNEMFAGGAFDESAPERVASELKAFARSVKNMIFVSDYIFCGAEDYDSYTQAYIKGLADIGTALAEISDCAVEAMLRRPVVYKGSLPE